MIFFYKNGVFGRFFLGCFEISPAAGLIDYLMLTLEKFQTQIFYLICSPPNSYRD
jgi:hypothetical protein